MWSFTLPLFWHQNGIESRDSNRYNSYSETRKESLVFHTKTWIRLCKPILLNPSMNKLTFPVTIIGSSSSTFTHTNTHTLKMKMIWSKIKTNIAAILCWQFTTTHGMISKEIWRKHKRILKIQESSLYIIGNGEIKTKVDKSKSSISIRLRRKIRLEDVDPEVHEWLCGK